MESKNHSTGAVSPPMPDLAAFRTSLAQAGAAVLPGGLRLGEFEIAGLINHSNAAVLYLAYDHMAQRYVALKEYLPDSFAVREQTGHVMPRPQEAREAYDRGLSGFLSEARLLARFDSPFLVKILRFWEANGTAYVAMPFYDGVTLRAASAAGRLHPNEDWIKALLNQLFDPVSMMHAAHCHHPGIAPDKIMLLADGRPLLLDFGTARRLSGPHAHGIATVMRAGFAPIEDYDDIPNLKQGPWTDVYALAAVAYFLVTGTEPPPSPLRLTRDAMTPAQQAGLGRYSESFLAAVDHALAVKPEHRLQSITQFRRELGLQAEADASTLHLPGMHAPGDAVKRTEIGLHPQRSKHSILAAGLAVLALVIATGFWWDAWRGKQTATDAKTTSQAAPTAMAGQAPYPSPAAVPEVPTPVAGRDHAIPEMALSAREETQWRLASSLNNAAAYQSYLGEYPEGRYASAARTALEGIRDRSEDIPQQPATTPLSEEEIQWNAVRTVDKRMVYESFLSKYPNSRYASAARASLARLKAAAEPRTAPEPARETAVSLYNGGVDLPGTDRTLPAAQAATSQPLAAPPALPPVASARENSPSAADRMARSAPLEGAALSRATAEAELAADSENEREVAQAPVLTSNRRTLRLPNQIMTGDFTADPVTGLVSGRGRIVWDNGDQFEGTMVRGQKEGKGEFRWANGQHYKGDWFRDQPNGKGSIQFPNGDRYTGDMRAGLPNGSGTLVFANGNRYRGEVRDGLPHGRGVNRFNNGDLYSGAWSRGKSHGQGRYTWANGSYWQGEFRDDAKTNNGQMVLAGSAGAAQQQVNTPGEAATVNR